MTQEQQRVINILAPLAVKCGAMHNVCSSMTIAQAILESGWLKSAIGGYAIFGVKGKGLTCTTKEYIDGKWITIKDSFETYKSYEDSFKGYYAFLENNARYTRHGIFGEWDYKKACEKIQSAGYATAPNYAATLIGIIESYGLSQYDEQALALRKQLYENQQTTTDVSTAQSINKKVTVSNAVWNVRSSPNGTVIKQISGGEYVSTQYTPGWYKLDALNGWIVERAITNSKNNIPASKTCTVKPGDSFWKIAQVQLGNGARYKEIIALNGFTETSVIHPGQVIKIPW